MIISLLNKIKAKELSIIASALIIVWIAFPLVTMLFNAIDFDTTTMYRIWISLMYIVGGIGTLLGIANIYKIATNDELEKNTKIKNLIPYFLFLIFGLWCVLSLKFTRFDFLAVLGYGIMQDNLLCYITFGGFILLGSIAVSNRKNALLLANLFAIIATFLSIIALLDNNVTVFLCQNEFTNCPQYYSVFYNTNHFGYYLTIAIVLVGALFVLSNRRLNKILYLLSFSLLILTLILNNTMGAYLGVLITLFFYSIWSIIIKERKKEAFILLFSFVVVSLASNLIVSNVFDNFASLFSNIMTIQDESSTQEELDAVGSNRGIIWAFGIMLIKKYPIFGIGLNNISYAVHNVYMQIAVYTGLVGLALYVLPFLAKTVLIIKDRNNVDEIQILAVFVAMSYMISAFFGLTIFYTAPYFYLIVGAAFGMTGSESKL